MSEIPQCTRCSGIFCYPNIAADQYPIFDEAPSSCPTRLRTDIIEEALSHYEAEEVREFARLASVQEFECYEHTPAGIRTRIPRIEETVQFARKNGYTKLGLAFCSGLANEARMVTDILESNGFEVASVCCKVGAVPKERLGIKPDEKISGPDLYESMCNPITQARILDEEGADFVILLGLCVGHDSLFLKHSNALCTVFAVKDRVLGHNPLAAVYNIDSFYRSLK